MTYPPRPAPGRHQFPPADSAPPGGYRPGAQYYDTAGSADTWWQPKRSGAAAAPQTTAPQTTAPQTTAPQTTAPPTARPEPPSWQPPRQAPSPEGQRGRVPFAEEPGWDAAHRHREPEPMDPQVRGQIAERLIRMNTSHALAAADRLGTKTAIGPHSLALFSVDAAPGRYARLSTATRLVLDGEDADNLPDLLADLAARAQEKIAEARALGQRWDPRTPLTGLVLRSEEITENTTYLGVGISTLDTPEAPWSHVKLGISSADGLHLRGQGFIYLVDGTAVHIVRRAQMSAGHHEITSTRRLDSQYPSRRDDYMLEKAEQQGDRIWELMRNLHEVLMTA